MCGVARVYGTDPRRPQGPARAGTDRIPLVATAMDPSSATGIKKIVFGPHYVHWCLWTISELEGTQTTRVSRSDCL